MFSFYTLTVVFLCVSGLVLLGTLISRERELGWRFFVYGVFLTAGVIIFAEGANLFHYWPSEIETYRVPFTFLTVENVFQFVYAILIMMLLLYEVRVMKAVRSRDQKHQALQEALDQKNTLLNEIHHRVKNNLQVIVSLLGLQERRIQDEEMKRILANCQNRIISMAMVHRKIYEVDVFPDVDLADYIPDLTNHLIDSHKSSDMRVTTKFDLASCRLNLDSMVTLGMVLAELITNILEHAFEEQERGTIEVSTREDEDGTLHLSVRSDGRDWAPDTPLSETSSLGLRLLDKLVHTQLNGSIEFARNNGSVVHISMPVESPRA